MYEMRYVNAGSIDEAIKELASGGQPLAGGMTLIPTMKQRLASPENLVDLSKCGLSGIKSRDNYIQIGAMTRHVDVAESKVVKAVIPALAALAAGIGDRQVRNRGTIGGSVANNDPSACYPAALLALCATVHTNNRDIAADDFFIDMFETALQDDEIITAISFPKVDSAAYKKFPNPASRYAMVGVFIARAAESVRVAVTGASSEGVFRDNGMEAALTKDFIPVALDSVAIETSHFIGDIHGSPEYRAHLVREMAKRAVESCLPANL